MDNSLPPSNATRKINGFAAELVSVSVVPSDPWPMAWLSKEGI
jgi:hypothetical protein